MSDDCVFCAIVDGELPSYDVYEDDDALAFLDANPVAEGHTLVVPKAHRERLTDMDAHETAAVFDAAREVAGAVEAAVDPDGYNLFQTNGAAAGQEVFHSHVHVVPRYEDDDVTLGFEPGDLAEERAEAVRESIREEL
jgi:histidine triad (HIT) family protein